MNMTWYELCSIVSGCSCEWTVVWIYTWTHVYKIGMLYILVGGGGGDTAFGA